MFEMVTLGIGSLPTTFTKRAVELEKSLESWPMTVHL